MVQPMATSQLFLLTAFVLLSSLCLGLLAKRLLLRPARR